MERCQRSNEHTADVQGLRCAACRKMFCRQCLILAAFSLFICDLCDQGLCEDCFYAFDDARDDKVDEELINDPLRLREVYVDSSDCCFFCCRECYDQRFIYDPEYVADNHGVVTEGGTRRKRPGE